jgi:hypothetical protein
MVDTKIVGHAIRMGWERRARGDKFRIVIELDQPPTWPVDVVWKATPIVLELKERSK